jgi:hypothetical protein
MGLFKQNIKITSRCRRPCKDDRTFQYSPHLDGQRMHPPTDKLSAAVSNRTESLDKKHELTENLELTQHTAMPTTTDGVDMGIYNYGQ